MTPAILIYLAKLSCSLGLLWLFYRLVLRNLTFYNWNRWYLLGYALLSFLIPFVNIGPIDQEDPSQQPLIIQYIPVIDKPVDPAALPVIPAHRWDSWQALVFFLALGSCFLLLRLLFRWYSLRRLRRQAVLLQQTPVKIYRVDRPIAPFSFGNSIYVNTEMHSEKEWEEIILHEYVHIRQRHTIDILVGELLVIVNWYNPFTWLIRYSIRQNLEFIADRCVVDNGADRKGYQYHLLKVLGQDRYRLANNFNFSSLKKRIIMMNKIRSARLHLLRFLFVMPLLTILLVAFRDRLPMLHSGKDLFVNAAGIVINMYEHDPISGVTVIETNSGLRTTTDANGYYKLHIPVRSDSVKVHFVYSKDGYESDLREYSFPKFRETRGLCDVGALKQPSSTSHGVFFIAPNLGSKTPADPGYQDALTELHRILRENNQMRNYMDLEKNHPEISLWYISEDHQKRILVHTNGTAERYGYPGTPTLAEMDAKYGSLPDFMTFNANTHLPGSGYLARWAAISAEAEKEFHTTNPTAKAIIFPGDSRVIGVPASGKAKVYDMDNDAPEERPAFEALFGPLPACVPAGFHYPKPIVHNRPTDTIPRNRDSSSPVTRIIGPAHHDPGKALWVIDGVIKPKGWDYKDSLHTEDIAIMNNLEGDDATRYFGEKGADGVIAIVTKKNNQLYLSPADPKDVTAPLYLVDGVPLEGDAMKSLDPNSIASIQVLKGQSAATVFGDKGRNGVILITTKKPALPISPQRDFHIGNSQPDTSLPG